MFNKQLKNKSDVYKKITRGLFAVSGAVAITFSGLTFKTSVDMKKSMDQIDHINAQEEVLLDDIQKSPSFLEWYNGLVEYLNVLEQQGLISSEDKKDALSSSKIREFLYNCMFELPYVENEFKERHRDLQLNLSEEYSVFEEKSEKRKPQMITAASGMGAMTLFYFLSKYKKKNKDEQDENLSQDGGYSPAIYYPTEYCGYTFCVPESEYENGI